MHVVQLTASNFKRLRAIDITPADDLVVIAGNNGNGKSSILDAIFLAIAGGRAARDTPDPIRHGEDKASVMVDLGELIVTRTWSKNGSTKLTVTGADGQLWSSPQQILDALFGALSFDPLAFVNSAAKDQRRTLLGLVDLPFDLDEIDARRAGVFEKRTDVNRDLKSLTAALERMPKPAAATSTLSLDDALAALNAASAVKASNDEFRRGLATAQRAATETANEVARLESELVDARRRAESAAAELSDWEADANLIPADPDMAELQAAVSAATAAAGDVRLIAEREQRAAEVAATQARADALTAQLEAIDQEKVDGLNAAEMPIPGLSIDDDGISFGGVPFSQCSGAERLRVSLAIAIAANPKLRVILIKDGSLLDDASLALVAEMAREHDMQVWLEKVDGSGQIGIVIEDGAVVAVNEATS